eukprot:6490328-Amphidinium_carterae.1
MLALIHPRHRIGVREGGILWDGGGMWVYITSNYDIVPMGKVYEWHVEASDDMPLSQVAAKWARAHGCDTTALTPLDEVGGERKLPPHLEDSEVEKIPGEAEVEKYIGLQAKQEHKKVFNLAITLGKTEHAEKSQLINEDEKNQDKGEYAALLDELSCTRGKWHCSRRTA